MVILEDFGATDAANHMLPAQVQVLYKEAGQGDQAAALVRAAVDRVDRQAQGAPPALAVATQVENAGIGLIDVFLPGLLGFNVIQAGLITAAGAFATYRTSGALRRVHVTGIAPGNLVLANATRPSPAAAGRPAQFFPGPAAAVIHVLPISLVTLGQSIKGDLLALAGWAVVLMAAASRAFRWDPA